MDSAALDVDWQEKLKDDVRFSLKWYQGHPATKEMLKADIHHGHLVDFGCGIGAQAFLARSLYPSDVGLLHRGVWGMDGSQVAIDYARAHWKAAGLMFLQADLLDLPWRDNLFDNGYMLAVIEHIEDTDKLLSECKRVIAPGGKLFVSVTDRNYHYDEHHVHAYNARGLGRILGAVGKHIRVYVKDHIIYATVEVE